jgi:carbonic anhydrase/acetyltransferase-like protein (isoleucine patch superfamily)
MLTGVEIHPAARIGRGLFIDHGMGVVIGETTIIGDRCHLLQGVTLGGTSTRHEKRHPTLEDDVVVGAGAKVIGAVTIGAGATIGAGSVVVSSVPPGATVVGVPGHVIAFTDRSNDTVVRLPDPEWNRIEELERRVDELEAELVRARANAEERERAHRRRPGFPFPCRHRLILPRLRTCGNGNLDCHVTGTPSRASDAPNVHPEPVESAHRAPELGSRPHHPRNMNMITYDEEARRSMRLTNT